MHSSVGGLRTHVEPHAATPDTTLLFASLPLELGISPDDESVEGHGLAWRPGAAGEPHGLVQQEGHVLSVVVRCGSERARSLPPAVAGFPVLIEPPVLARDASGSFSSRSLTRRTVSRLNLFAHIMGMLPVRTARPGHGVRLQLNPERSGTIGCAVAYRTPGPRRNIFLTCRHTLTEGENGPVPAAPDELVILRRNPYRKRRVLGSVSAFKWDDPSARSLDVALINVGNDIPNVLYTPRGISRLTKEPIGVDAALRSRCTVQKVGFKTNYSLGRVMGLFRLRVRSADGRSHVYKRVFEIWRDHPARPFCDRQDSGSVAWTYPTVPGGLAQPVGMICATSKGPLLGYAVPMADIVNDLDVEVRID